MCGIAGFHIKPQAKGKIEAGLLMDWLLKGIEHRGKEATGFLAAGFDSTITVDKAPVTAMQFIQTRKPIPSAPQTILGHTRLATQGPVEHPENNHPVAYGTVFVTHNGWIYNDEELFRSNDMERTAEVDTIAIPAMLWNYNENGFQPDSVKYALEQLQGAMAVAAVDVTDPGKLLLARGNSSPLYLIENDKIIIWASTVSAIQQAWGKVFGTPPKRERFKEFTEGEFRLIKNGETIHEGTFVPTYISRYNWGYNGLDDSFWYSEHKAVQDKLDEQEAAPTAAGTWINMPDGSRTWMPVDDAGNFMVPQTAAKRPDAHDVEILRSMGAWAKLDAKAHENTIYDLSNELQLPMGLVAWLRLYCDQEVIDANPSVQRAVEWIAERYQTMYDDELAYLLESMEEEHKDDTPPVPNLHVVEAEAVEVPLIETREPWKCLSAGCDNDTEDMTDFYCGPCIIGFASNDLEGVL